MFKLLLEGQKHVLSSRNDTSLLLRNIKTDIQMKVASRNGSQFVLIIDEMQLLNEIDLQQLLVFHNALALEKIKMTTVAFAQPEIIHRVNALQTKHQTQIIARFLSEPLMFEGCGSAEELRALLKLYDEESEYPDDSGISYTKFFFPEAFARGFRLSKYANKIWHALKKAIPALPETGLPMEHVCLTIEHLLLAHRQYDAANFTYGTEDIEEAVEASNLRNFVSYVKSASG
ncbi:MAG TPA: ATP-binding protein [Paucimonas sp.]|nr:ATP-binding protein [Paucimonas sp.]